MDSFAMPLIRPATSADTAMLSAFACKVFVENFGMLYDEADMNEHLQKTCSSDYFQSRLGTDHILLAVADDTIIGYAKLGEVGLPGEYESGAKEIHRFYIDAAFHGTGISHALMKEVLAALVSAPAIYLGVWEHNHRAQRFYKSYGFTEIGEYPYHVGKTTDRELIFKR